MDQRCVSEKIRQYAATFTLEFQAAIRQDGLHLITDLVHVRDHSDALRRAGGTRWKMQNQISATVGLGLGPRWEQLLYCVTHVRFVAAHGISLAQALENRLNRWPCAGSF